MTDPSHSSEFDRQRTAWHECGHGLSHLLLRGRSPELVSIRPGQAYRGVTLGTGGDPWQGTFEPQRLSILQPADLRRVLEQRIVVSLAGDVGADLGALPRSGYRPITADEQDAETTARALNQLSPRHRELLAAAESASDVESDDEAAIAWSFVLSGSQDESIAHLSWLRHVTRRLLSAHIDGLSRLVPRLLEVEVLDGATFSHIARKGRCGCHRWPTTPSLP